MILKSHCSSKRVPYDIRLLVDAINKQDLIYNCKYRLLNILENANYILSNLNCIFLNVLKILIFLNCFIMI